MGRPRKVIDGALVQRLARIHCTYNEIAAAVGCSTDTLKRRFADRIEKGREAGKASLRRWQFKAAKAGNPTMLVWLGKQHLEQTDRQAHELTGAHGGPILTRELSTAELREKLAQRLTAVAGRLAQVPAPPEPDSVGGNGNSAGGNGNGDGKR